MKFGVKWNVRGVRPEVRDSAREAARKSGMSVGEWLNHVIAEQAADDEAEEDLNRDPYDEDDRLAERALLTERIDRLDQRLGQILAKGPAPIIPRETIFHAAPRSYPQPYAPAAYAPQPQYIAPPAAASPPPWESSIEQAVAEISARQHSLDSPLAPQSYMPAPPPPPQPVYAPPPASYYPPAQSAPLPPMPLPPMPAPAAPAYAAPVAPAYNPPAAPEPVTPVAAAPVPPLPRLPQQDLSGLEGQLRNITELIERLHQPKDNEEIAILRRELAEIGNKLTQAMPQRAIEALELETRKIAERIDETRVCGVDPATISGMERGLIDVRDALRELKPAESLAGFEEAIRNLSLKIEQMGVASHDPAFLQQLEAAITALRGIVSHVASNDSLGMLADEMRGLSAKIERVAGAAAVSGPDMSALEQKIAALTEQLKTTNGGAALPPRIESLLNNFSDRMERNELSSGEHYALGTLEDRIVNLAAKLDASDARLNQLSAIERGMAELLVHIEELRTNGLSSAPRNEIKREEIKREIAKAKDSIEAVNGTVETVVDRLAVLESERRDPAAAEPAPAQPPRAAMQPDQPASAPAVFADAKMPEPVARPKLASPPPPSAPAVSAAPAIQAAPPVKAGPPAAQPRRPIDPNLPPDYPLEPGSGVPRERGVSAADRIAASEAALGGISPAGSVTSGSTNFIAAARRAAQAAAPADAGAAKSAEDEKPAGAKSFRQRMRSMIAGASVVALVAGGLTLSMRLLNSTDQTVELPVATAAQIAGNIEDAPPAQQPSALSPSRFSRAPDTVSAPSLNSFQQAEKVPVPDADQDSPGDITASIGNTTPQAPAAIELPLPAAGDQRLMPSDKLPAALRSAAMNGDPAAAYEIAMRHMEGRGVSQSLEDAARWLERGAKAGLAPAQFRLGSLYEKGQGVKKSIDTAQRLYQAAAQKGNAKAMHNLAVLYAEGAQGKPDYKTAAGWFRKAAERGIADSQYNLGILYARGIGVEQNLPEAYKWFSLAGAQGDKEATKKRDDVAGRLDAASLNTARLAIQTFKVEPQPEEASMVKAPDGGWDRASPAPKAPKKPRAIEPLRITPS